MADLAAFVDTIAPEARATRRELMEKDYLLHLLLAEVGARPGLRDRLLLKGGTCLLKTYLGYYRFSEDADFTWRDQDRWTGRTPRAIRNECSELIGTLTEEIGEVADDLGLGFVADKADRRYVEASSGGRMVRFYLWFDSAATSREQPLKFEVSFVDTLVDPPEVRDLGTYISEIKDVSLREIISYRFPEELEAYTRAIRLPCYSPKEIYLEKCRAVMTRVGFKWRDLVDIVHLENGFGFDILGLRGQIIEKTLPVLAFSRYQESLERMTERRLDRMPAMEEGLLLDPPSEDLIARMSDDFETLKGLAIDLSVGASD